MATTIRFLTRTPRSIPLLPAATIRTFSVLSRPPPNYPGHIPLTVPERVALGVGSALICFFNPRRADLIAACGEATAVPYFIYRLRDAMLADPTGRRILKDRPRITSKSLDLNKLRNMKDGTVGREYVRWLDREGVSPDTRSAVSTPTHRPDKCERLSEAGPLHR
jgi:ubiquinone biosynthesis protein COQ4